MARGVIVCNCLNVSDSSEIRADAATRPGLRRLPGASANAAPPAAPALPEVEAYHRRNAACMRTFVALQVDKPWNRHGF